MLEVHTELGYDLIDVPRVSVAERVGFVRELKETPDVI
jgi:predicted ATPase